MPSSRRRAAGSANTIFPSASRSRLPSARSRWSPNASATAANPGVPAATTSRASASASITIAPCAASNRDTALLPDPIPPVNPTVSTPRVFHQAPTGTKYAATVPNESRRRHRGLDGWETLGGWETGRVDVAAEPWPSAESTRYARGRPGSATVAGGRPPCVAGGTYRAAAGPRLGWVSRAPRPCTTRPRCSSSPCARPRRSSCSPGRTRRSPRRWSWRPPAVACSTSRSSVRPATTSGRFCSPDRWAIGSSGGCRGAASNAGCCGSASINANTPVDTALGTSSVPWRRFARFAGAELGDHVRGLPVVVAGGLRDVGRRRRLDRAGTSPCSFSRRQALGAVQAIVVWRRSATRHSERGGWSRYPGPAASVAGARAPASHGQCRSTDRRGPLQDAPKGEWSVALRHVRAYPRKLRQLVTTRMTTASRLAGTPCPMPHCAIPPHMLDRDRPQRKRRPALESPVDDVVGRFTAPRSASRTR